MVFGRAGAADVAFERLKLRFSMRFIRKDIEVLVRNLATAVGLSIG